MTSDYVSYVKSTGEPVRPSNAGAGEHRDFRTTSDKAGYVALPRVASAMKLPWVLRRLKCALASHDNWTDDTGDRTWCVRCGCVWLR